MEGRALAGYRQEARTGSGGNDTLLLKARAWGLHWDRAEREGCRKLTGVGTRELAGGEVRGWDAALSRKVQWGSQARHGKGSGTGNQRGCVHYGTHSSSKPGMLQRDPEYCHFSALSKCLLDPPAKHIASLHNTGPRKGWPSTSPLIHCYINTSGPRHDMCWIQGSQPY